ncbi:hypothetical protein V8E51_018523 [Hyaloscypha variabilis]
MADICALAHRAREKLTQEVSCNDPLLRRVVGHARLLDQMFVQLAVTESRCDGAQDEVSRGLREERHKPRDAAADGSESESESDSDSDSDSDLAWLLDPDTGSDRSVRAI